MGEGGGGSPLISQRFPEKIVLWKKKLEILSLLKLKTGAGYMSFTILFDWFSHSFSTSRFSLCLVSHGVLSQLEHSCIVLENITVSPSLPGDALGSKRNDIDHCPIKLTQRKSVAHLRRTLRLVKYDVNCCPGLPEESPQLSTFWTYSEASFCLPSLPQERSFSALRWALYVVWRHFTSTHSLYVGILHTDP